MDPSLYKNVTTSNGINYHYFFSPSTNAKPTILFVHGFPSTSNDWRHQVAFFRKEGYGLIVPDMIGYGGTDKPHDVALYKMSVISANLIDILNAEKVDKAIAVGHDWGSGIVSRLASYYPERFLGFGFLAVSYMPPNPAFDIHQVLAYTKQAVGYELFGYWLFFDEDGADKIIEEHIDSTISILYPHDPKSWITDMAPTNALKAYLLADKKGPLPSYVTEAEKEELKKTLLSGGFAAPLNYYKTAVRGLNTEDEKKIPQERYTVNQPVFFGGALQDYICLSAPSKATIGQLCQNVTIKEFDADHWLQMAVPDQVNKELLAWIEEIKV